MCPLWIRINMFSYTPSMQWQITSGTGAHHSRTWKAADCTHIHLRFLNKRY